MVEKVTLPYVVKSVRSCGSLKNSKCEVELELDYSHTYLDQWLPSFQGGEMEEWLKIRRKEADRKGFPAKVKVSHTSYNYHVRVDQVVGVGFVYEEVLFLDDKGQPENRKLQVVERQELAI